jgi:hypothetical protein
MINRIRKLYILPLVLAGLTSACSPGGESPNPPASNTSRQPQQAAPQSAPQKVSQQPVAAPVQAPPAATTTVVPAPPPPPPPANAPKIFVAATRIDFGKQPMEKSINRSIVVKNVGKSELKIESVVPS